MPKPPILLTRPRAASEALAARLAAAGVTGIEISPLLDIQVVAALPVLADGLIFTSRNGVAAYAALRGPPGRATWCVGPRTAEAAAAHGLEVRGTAPVAEALASVIPDGAPALLHLRGTHQHGDLVGALRARGLSARDAVLYDQVAVPLTAHAQALVAAGPVVAPLYSPRTARLLAEAVDSGLHRHILAVCISQAVVDAAPFACHGLAETPDGSAMERAVLSMLATIGG